MAIKLTDLYWAAGFLEGEGIFVGAYLKRHSTGKIRKSAVFSINAAQNEREMLDKLQQLFGGHIYYSKNGKAQNNYRWYLNGRRGLALMMTLWALMSQKRRAQIELCLERFKSNAQPLSSYRMGV